MPLKRLIQQARRVLGTLPGRLFVLTAGLLVVISALTLVVTPLPQVLEIFRKVVRLAFLVSIAWLVTGRTVGGMQLYPRRNCLDRETALRMWTENVTWFSNEQGRKGRIAIG